TFFAFILVCAGGLYMDHTGLSEKSKFWVPYINGKCLVGLGVVAAWILVYQYGQVAFQEWKEMQCRDNVDHRSMLVDFCLLWSVLAIMSFRYQFSLLPVAGILINLYLMSQLGASNWIIFLIWLVIGLTVYFAYGFRHSKLNE